MKTQLGHYDIVAELGRGGMGVVYKGYEPALNRYVAIKVLAESLAHDESVKERFLREARSMAALNDPHIIQIYFIGEDAGQTFFVMEFVEGESLGSLLKREGKLAPEQAARVIFQTAQGLATAHDKGVIHRDIKPGNLMIGARGQVKIADFGIALVTQDFSKKLTSTGEFVGTPGYLSPEVCLGKPVDQRSDIFSLGIVLFEMLTGRMPFTDESPLGLMLEVVKAEIPDVRQLNQEVDPELSRILAKMIAKEPADRYQSCQELAAELQRHPALASGQTLTLKPAVSTAAMTLVGAKTPVSGQRPLPATTPTPRPASLPNVTPPPAPAPAAVEASTVPSAARPSVLDRQGSPPAQASRPSVLPWAIAAALLLAAGAGAWTFRAQIPFLANLGGATPAAVDATANTTAPAPSPPAPPVITPPAATVPPPATVAPSGTAATADTTPPAAAGGAAAASAPAAEAVATAPPPTAPSATATADSVAAAPGEAAAPEPRASRVDALKDLAAARAAQDAPGPRLARIAEPERPVAPPKPHVPTIAVLAGGDDVIAEPAQQELVAALQRAGYNVIEEGAMPRVAHMLANGDYNAALAAVSRSGRVDGVVFINVKAVGTQQLQYYGRSSTAFNAQLSVRAYHVGARRMLGPGWTEQVIYTGLNAAEKAREAMEPVIEAVDSNLDEFRPRRRRG
ncbi:MAG TPA: protein kinase [Rhodanobacteraceae bacterium]|nr:protein kinase [Rhodanobacteraceae bacterium]